jgi:hypothetical protein
MYMHISKHDHLGASREVRLEGSCIGLSLVLVWIRGLLSSLGAFPVTWG